MPRSHLRSKIDPEALIQRAGSWLINFLPVRIVRLCWLMLWHRQLGLTGALTGWLPYRIRPLTYFGTASLVFAFAISLHPVYRSDVRWFDVWTTLDAKDALSVWDNLKLPLGLLDTIVIENYLPNTSPASKAIKDKIGSDDGLKFALYVGTFDSRLGSILAAKAVSMQKLNTYEDKARDFALPFIFQAAIIPLFFLGNTRKKSFTQTSNVWFAMQATWLFVGSLLVVLGGIVSFGHNSSSLAIALFDLLYLISSSVYHYRGFHFTHGTGKLRFASSLVLGFVIIVLLTIGLELLLDSIGARLEHYLALI